MDWIRTTPLFLATCLLALQGCIFIRWRNQARYMRCSGHLAILLASLGVTTFFLVGSDSLILSPEYAVVMAQGRAALIGLAALILGFSVAAGLGWYVAGCAKSQPSHPFWILTFSAAVGFLSILRINVLNPNDAAALQVHSYDFWWPFLLVWFGICFSEAALATIRVDELAVRVWGALSVCLVIFLEGVHRANLGLQYADPFSQTLMYCLFPTLPGWLALGTWLFLKKIGPMRLRSSRWVSISLASAAGAAGVVSGLFWIIQPQVSWVLKPWFLCSVWLAIVAVFALVRVFEARRTGALQVTAINSLTLIYYSVSLLALIAVVAGLMDLIHFGWLEPLWDLTGMTLFAVLLVELLGGGPLRSVTGHQWVKKILAAEAPLLAFAGDLGQTLRAALSKIASSAKNIFKADSLATMALKVLVVVAILVAASEIPNSGKTVVQPFTTLGFSDKDENSKDLGRQISDRVVNTLGLIRQELRPSMITLSPLTGGNAKSEIRILDTGQDTSSLDASVKSSDFEIPGTKINIPLSWFTDLIQGPMRGLLGVRVVRGTVQLGPEGKLSLLVSSTTGETWRAPEPFSTSPSSASANDPKDPAAGICSMTSNNGSSQISQLPGQIAALGDELAAKLVSSDPALIEAGMTTSWRAVEPFREGLVDWDAFNTRNDYVCLQSSISKFQQAIKIDQAFPWAYYYLGMALRQDGQPGAAVLAFRHSLQASPKLYRAQTALSETLYDFETYYLPPPAVLLPSSSISIERDRKSRAHQARAKEARELRQRLIRFPPRRMPRSELAAAYAGLALDALDSRDSDDALPGEPMLAHYYLDYFYGKRAEHLYAGDPNANVAEAYALDGLGVLFDSTVQTSHKDPPELPADVPGSTAEAARWHCSVGTVFFEGIGPEGQIVQRFLSRSPYSGSALKYYLRALALQPEDPVIRCNYASAAYSQGNLQPMMDLDMDDHAHLQTARDLIDVATKDEHMASYYRAALAEFEEAIKLAPDNAEALNEYAYSFWCWRLRTSDQKPPAGPEPEIAHKAELYSRKAVNLVDGKSDFLTQASYRSTLGEVLLGQARAEEASKELEKVKIESSAHAIYDEIRWDTALAYLCAFDDDWINRRISDAEYEGGISKAANLFKEITMTESSREDQPFTTSNDHELEGARRHNVCVWNSQQPGWQPGRGNAPGPRGTATEQVPEHPRFELQGGKPTYSTTKPCAWEGIIPAVTGVEDDSIIGLQIHVWGGGVDKRLTLPKGSEQPDDIFLTNAPRSTFHYYFAQLENAAQVPVSYVYPIETFDNMGDGACPRNYISLTFTPAAQ